MCGIAGLVDWTASTSPEVLRDLGLRMSEAVIHRGPDAGGQWCDADAGVSLVQRRLAIIDLSPGGLQPMHSADGRYVIVYNGEIYNYQDIASELRAAGRELRSTSDTEVLVEACAQWGIETALRRTVGMFAFALWDRTTRTLSLARDRMGKKPLYYAAIGDRILFGSQLKSLRAIPDFKPTLDQDALVAYLRHNYVPQPHSIHREVKKVPQGHILHLRKGNQPVPSCYYDIRSMMRAAQADPLHEGAETEIIATLDTLLRSAIKFRMIADVPLGAFLSGGIDSSLVVALMQAQSNSCVRTFSIGFREAGFDEAPHAKAIAEHLDCDHTEFYVSPEDARTVIPSLPEWFDEPFADASQIPTFLVSRMTRKSVTVALSGDGGDELFGGYSRYFWAERMSAGLAKVPRSMRRISLTAATAIAPSDWDALSRLLPAPYHRPLLGDKVHKLAHLLRDDDPIALYRNLVSQWQDPLAIVTTGQEPNTVLWDATTTRDFPDLLTRMQFLDTVTYLPDDVLVKVDRASMAVALEARAPLLDHRVAEYAWRLPRSLKVRDGKGKWALRRVLDRYVPRALIERPKQGFAVPIDTWLRGPLREWAEDLLSPKELEDIGLRPAPIRAVWDEHLTGTRNWQYQLWTILMLQSWRRRWM